MLIQKTETPFGTVEISKPDLYDTPIPDKVILKVDTLDCLRPLLGSNCFICRDLLYSLLSGSHEDINKLFASFYRRFPEIRAYVNDKFLYGDESVPLLERSLFPLRKQVDDYRVDVFNDLNSRGGKYLVTTHDYIYFAFKSTAVLPDIKGAIKIC